jgi:hypothetical protein
MLLSFKFKLSFCSKNTFEESTAVEMKVTISKDIISDFNEEESPRNIQFKLDTLLTQGSVKIKDIKHRIERETRISVETQTLVLDRTVLDSEKTLEEVGVNDESELLLIINHKGEQPYNFLSNGISSLITLNLNRSVSIQTISFRRAGRSNYGG